MQKQKSLMPLMMSILVVFVFLIFLNNYFKLSGYGVYGSSITENFWTKPTTLWTLGIVAAIIIVLIVIILNVNKKLKVRVSGKKRR